MPDDRGEAERALTKVRALFRRALDPGASEEERRTSAIIAVKLVDHHGLLNMPPEEPVSFVDSSEVCDVDPYADDGVPQTFDPENFTVIEGFDLGVANGPGKCAKCGKTYAKGEVIARSHQNRDRKAHYGCRRVFA